MKNLKLFKSLLVLIGVLITSLTTQMWAYDAGFSLRGTSASISSGHEVNTYFGTDSKYCIYIWLTKNETFYLVNTSSTAYGPSTDNKEVKHGTAEAAGTYNSNKWKYTGNTGLVRICVDQSSNEWYPKVSVEEMTTILTGSQIMFYFGDSWGWGTKYINNGTSDVFSGNAGFNEKNTFFTIARVAAARYYVSNQAKSNWGGEQMGATASAGAFYRLNNDGGSNTVSTTAGVVPEFGTTSYSKATGTVNSGIAVNTLGKSSTSRDQTVYYYYSTDGGTTWTGFSPSDISGLAANTYKVRAIACDGLICVKSSNEATLTIADAPVVNLSVEDGSSNVISSALSGQTITLKATASHCGSTPTISYRYSTSSSFASYTQIASTTSTSQTWTVPASTSEVTYYLRAYVTSSGYECNTSNSTLTAYGKKTIHVRNTNDWGTFKIHHWGTNDPNGTTWSTGTTTGITSAGGQWQDVVIYSCYDGFILFAGTGGDNNQTGNLDYDDYTNGTYYVMSTSGTRRTLSSTDDTPSVPSVTTQDATASTSTSATFYAKVTDFGNDKATYGVAYKQVADQPTAATIYAATKAQISNAVNADNTSGNTGAKTITAGVNYWYVAYAFNGQSSGAVQYGSVKCLRTTAVTLDNQSATTAGQASVVAIGGKAMPSIAANKPAKTGYNFGGYWTGASGSGTKYYNTDGSSANNWPTNEGATQTLKAYWIPKTSTVTLNVNGATSGSNQTITATYGSAMPSTDNSSNAIAKPSKTGYDFGGYYDTSSSSGGTQYYSSANPPASVRTWNKEDATTSLWARWTPQTYTAADNINKNNSDGGGSTAGTYTATYMSNKIVINTAPTRLGCHVEGYYQEAGCTHKIADASGNLQANTDYTDASSRWDVTSNQTLYVKWEADWYVCGEGAELGSWSHWATGAMYYSAANTVQVSLPLTVNTGYSFKIQKYDGSSSTYWRNGDISSVTGTVSSKTLNSSSGDNMSFTSSASGNYTFTLNIATPASPSLTLTYPSVFGVTFGSRSVYNEGASSDNTTTGGSIAAVDGYSKTLTSGNKVISGGSVVFTATPAAGYTFDGWYSDNTCTTGITHNGTTIVVNAGAKTLTLSSIAADKTVYAKFSEKMTTVNFAGTHGHVEIGGATVTSTTVGKSTSRSITAVPDAGYYFSGWTKTEGTDYNVGGLAEANATTTLSGLGGGQTSGQTLTANFQPLEKIYFRNVFDDGVNEPTRWSNVYVYFGITWESGRAVSNSNASFKVAMTQIGETDVYWAYVPRAFTLTAAPLGKQVAFSNASYTTSFKFYHETASHDKAATRGDYNKALNMFVPHHTAKSVNTGSGGVDYFDNGYWMKYDTRASQGAGYYLKKYNSRNSYTQEGEFIATNDDATFIQFTLRIDAASSTLNYMITSAGALNYVAASTVTAANCSDIALNENTETLSDHDVKFSLTTASEGMYTFIIDQSGDKMKLNVLYPVAVGDYRLKHEYTDGSAKSSYSDVIKSAEASSGKTVSMYLNMSAGTKSLKLEKCTAVTAGKPVWGSSTTVGTGSGFFNTTTFSKGKGVYLFDVTVADNAVSTIANAGLYEGNYYIKTDCAPGGWANYKQNILNTNTINFSSSDANTFDYFFCKNISSAGTNVKFVVANDYNNAVSDTLVADATYLTTSGGGTSKEFLPEACCVRFSYNSATNTVKRAYLRYSGNNNFLNIIPSAASKVYTAASAGTDLSGAAESVTKLSDDDGNYVYKKTVYALSGAEISIRATYNSQNQTFASGQKLITSTNKLTRYPVRIVYDFKTNNLTTAWEATTGLTDKLSDIEFIYVRDGQDAANQVTLGDGGAISDSKVCGVFQFDYNTYVGHFSSWNSTTYGLGIFYFSFPFDVNVSDIFGIGTYGKEWKIQYYDGAGRAKKGFFRGDGTTTFWKDVPADSVLTANVGYSLMLDNDYFNTTADGMVFQGKSSGQSVYLYFPSASTISIASGATSIDVPEHECTLTHSWTEGGKTLYHSKTDSHWNMMGVPLFQNQTGDFSETFKAEVDYTKENPFGYLYEWNPATNSLSIVNASSFTFKSMNAYMVQYTGTVNFSGSHVASSVAARQIEETHNYTIDLEVLDGDDERINHTYIELREGASDEFELNEDVYMSLNKNAVNIYSYAGDYDVAANVMSVSNHVVPVGVTVKTSGTYKFSMPSIFSGTVTLVDTYDQTRTNLALGNYDVYLEPGTYVGRFYLELDINNAPTAVDGTETGEGTLKDGKAHKFIMNDMMYILRDGIIYDAQGKKVE